MDLSKIYTCSYLWLTVPKSSFFILLATVDLNPGILIASIPIMTPTVEREIEMRLINQVLEHLI